MGQGIIFYSPVNYIIKLNHLTVVELKKRNAKKIKLKKKKKFFEGKFEICLCETVCALRIMPSDNLLFFFK